MWVSPTQPKSTSSGNPAAWCAPSPATAPIPDKGIGGLDIRAKYNFWGNDGFEKPGDTALGLLPSVTFPTDRGNGISPETVSGGIIVPFAVKLTDKFSLGLNGGLDIVRADDSTHITPNTSPAPRCPTAGPSN